MHIKMEDNEKLSYRRLEQRTYRSLQQLAKSLDLPSNFKKMYLVELIQARKFKSQTEVNNIIHRVKLERLQLSRTKRENQRKRMQFAELPSTSRTIFSPPITHTPKRPGHMYLLCSPDSTKSLKNYNPKRNLMHSLSQNASSDRILRSFNMKTVKPNYALLSGQEIKPQSSRETRIKIVTNGGFPNLNVMAKCVVKKHKPNILNSSLTRPLMLTDSLDLLNNPIKCQRTLSGIYPLLPESIPREIHSTESVCLRKIDGSVTKINAIVQKRNIDFIPKQKTSYRNTTINTQDAINTMEEEFTESVLTGSNVNNNYLQIQYPNMSALDNYVNNHLNTEITIENNVGDDNLDVYSVYYHKKIRSELIRCQKLREMQDGERLPRINDVFSKFNNVHRIDLTQPLYVQVSTESERCQSHPLFTNRNQFNTITLETVYNIKNNLLTNAPLLQIATTCMTECVYTTPIITTPIAQPSTVVSNDAYITSCQVDDGSHEVDPRLYEFLQFPEQNVRRNYNQHDEFNTSTSSLETSQDLSSATIPEMVEDALEIISQDGDYMEQITMDVRVQCVFCSWAGPKVILEYHIRKEHAAHVHQQYSSTWSITCSLEAVCARALLRVVEHNAALYLLRAVYRDPDWLVATLTSLSTETEVKIGSITICNRLSGEPFSWSGQIQPSPPNFIFETENCLKIELSKLDLLPNSANLKLLNRELVSDSPSKAVVGQPILNDIHLILYVKIFN